MRLLFLFPAFWWLCVTSLGGAEEAVTLQNTEALAWSAEDFHRDVLLMRVPDAQVERDAGSETLGAYLEDQLGRKLDEAEKALFARGHDGAWRRYEDALVGFDLPADSLLKIAVAGPDERAALRVVGGRVGSTDNRFRRAYKITVGESVPYLILLVSEAEEFDDGICFCGHVAFECLRVADGVVRRFSLLEDGSVKKVQVLDGKRRAVLLEWTHTSLTQAAYARIAASIRLKGEPPLSETEWRGRLSREDWRAAGWLRRGDDVISIRCLLGPETRLEADAVVYERDLRGTDGGGNRWALSIPLVKGRFEGFEHDPMAVTELDPLPETLAWAEKIVKGNRDDGPQAKPARKAGLAVLRLFKEQAPVAPANEWDDWCWLVFQLHRQGVSDPEVIPVVQARFPEAGLSQFNAAWVLDCYEAEGRDALFAGRIRVVLEESKTARVGSMELGNLYSHLAPEWPEYGELMEAGLTSANADCRSSALLHADKLPEEPARRAARRALECESIEHNLTMAGYLIRDVGREEDLEWLTARKNAESNPKVAEVLEDAIKEIARREQRAEVGRRARAKGR